jgi:hypothetical protein
VDDVVVEVDVIPHELAKFARAQAKRNRQDEQRFEPVASIGVEFCAAEAAGDL